MRAQQSEPEFDPAAGEIPAHLEIYAPPSDPFPWRRFLISTAVAGAIGGIVHPLHRIRDLVQWLVA